MRGKKRTHEEFVSEIQNINPTIKIVGVYANAKTKVKCLCLICGNEWNPAANSLLQGHSCPICAGTQRKTHEKFVEEMSNISPNIMLDGTYVNATTKIKCRCKVCNNEWSATPTSLLRGTGCMECAKKRMSYTKKKAHDEFVCEMKVINPNIKVQGEYIDGKTKIKCECLICHREWDVIPNSLLQGSCCPHCDRDRRMKTHENFVNQMKCINSNIEIIGTYLGVKAKIKCRCRICGNVWDSRAGHILNGAGCPKCIKSKGENKIEDFLKRNNINYVSQKKFESLFGIGGGRLSYDFYIPSHNILIEYQGEQHYVAIDYFGGYENLQRQQEHDKRKRNFANKYKYDLIEIRHTDFSKIENILYNKLIFQRG